MVISLTIASFGEAINHKSVGMGGARLVSRNALRPVRPAVNDGSKSKKPRETGLGKSPRAAVDGGVFF
jgi:hypothetical protein